MPDNDVTIASSWEAISLFDIDDTGGLSGLSEYYNSLGESAPTDLVIPTGVTKIYNQAFTCNTNITSVVLPEGIESVGGMAFNYCPMLKSVTLPSTLKIISDNMFASCETLSTVTISEGVTEIANSAFAYCPSLKHIIMPSTIERIHPTAFLGNSRMTIIINKPENSIPDAPWGAVNPYPIEWVG